MKCASNKLDGLSINTIRMLAVDAIEKANSGHPGMPMGMAAPSYVLWTKFLRHNPINPNWPNRDRFVLSGGHGSMLLYALLHLTGYELSLEELKKFRQWGSKTPGHPEYGLTPGVETTTGPLGQGFANAVGMALAESVLASRFNRPGYEIVSNYTYVEVGDGDLMEGISHEAASLAGNLGLGKLICLYDCNKISIEGKTEITYTEDPAGRFTAYGWHVEVVKDGNDLNAVEEAIIKAQQQKDKPSLLVIRTEIGFGSPNKQGKASAHGSPLGTEEVKLTRENLGWSQDEAFHIPPEVLAHFRESLTKGQKWEKEWTELYAKYSAEHQELAREWELWQKQELPEDWAADIPEFSFGKKIATRSASGEVLNAIARRVNFLLGGSADLAPSTKHFIKDTTDLSAGDFNGRNIRFGVREHAMGAVVNGLAVYGGIIPFGSTFLSFANYMFAPLRIAAMNGLKEIQIFTHDSIGVGEDGPTHQPVEHLLCLRALPGLTVVRPADANEAAEAWRWVLAENSGPAVFILSRQDLPVLNRKECGPASGLQKGAYVLWETKDRELELIIIATGSEVHIALEGAQAIAAEGRGVRVVSMPSWELFDQASQEYKEEVLPSKVRKRISLEAGSTLGWSRYTTDEGIAIGLDHYGASAPAEVLYQEYGITAENVVAQAHKLLGSKKNTVCIAVGADHGGFPLKETVLGVIEALGLKALDLGTYSTDPVDYPDIAKAVGKAVSEGQAQRGIVLCGSGIGASVAANKIKGVRAGVCHDIYSAHQCVEHDDANVLCLGARVIGPEPAKEIVASFLKARFTAEERHQRRLDKVIAIEQE